MILEWLPGYKTELAKRSGVSLSYLCDVLRGRKRATPENATRIAAEAQSMGLMLERLDLLYPHESTNPLIDVTPTKGGEE